MRDRFGGDEFNKLKSRLEKLAKPAHSGETIEAAIDKSMGKDPAPVSPRSRTPGHARGFLGEERNEQFIQKSGEISVSDKLGIKALTKGGYDAVSVGLDARDGKMILKIYENKAYARTGNVSAASAIQKNDQKNLSALIARSDAIAKDKKADAPTRALHGLVRDLAKSGRVERLVTGEGGNLTGTSIPGTRFVKWDPANPATRAGGGKVAPDRPTPPPRSGPRKSAEARAPTDSPARPKPPAPRSKSSATSRPHADRPTPPSAKGTTAKGTHAPARTGSSAPAVPKSPTSLAATLSPKGGAPTSTPMPVTISPAFAPGKPKM